MIKPTLALAGLLAAAAAVWHVVTPRVEPPLGAGVYDSIHSFERDHPEWRVLDGQRADLTPLKMGHQLHMDPDTPQMQQRLAAWVQELREAGYRDEQIPVRDLGAGKLALACNACHVPDAAGLYVQPIRFAQHCVQCHSLGTREDEPVPHGVAARDFLQRQVAMSVAAPRPKVETAAPRRGPGGRGSTAASTPVPVTFPSAEEMNKELASRYADARERTFTALRDRCVKCHVNIMSLREEAPQRDWTKMDMAALDPRIPDRWLPRSFFNHGAHRLMNCTECHTAAAADAAPRHAHPGVPSELSWTGATQDIMLPSIESCRVCHGTQGKVRHDCVTCHTFHAPDRPLAGRAPAPP